jgi:hypothetical protein
MAFNLPPPPVGNDVSGPAFRDWFYKIRTYLSQPIDLSNVTGILGIGNGGTGTSDVPANGELLIGNGTGYSVNTLTAGANITITNGAGTITIASSGGGGGTTFYNKLPFDVVVPTDTSYMVLSYFDLNGFTLTVDGNFGVIG